MKRMLFFCLVGFVTVGTFANNSQPATAQTQNGYAFAVDFSAPASASVFKCLRASGYRTVFLRVYNPSGSGQFDATSVSNIRRAFSERLGVEVYMTPQYRSFKNGSVQFTEIIDGLNSAGIKINSIWIQVTSPVNWDPYPQNNVFFLNQVISVAQKYRIGLGFYTNFYDWSQITNDAWVNGSQLWYWNVRGGGSRGETLPDFSDFRPFGKWTKPIVKQFAQVENICGVTLNRDVYSVNGAKQVLAATEQKAENPVVGATFGNIASEGLLQNHWLRE